MSLGDEKTVRGLIENRSKIDPAFSACLSAADVSVDISGGTPSVMEDVMCVYIDLERLIEECGLTRMEHATVSYLMQGYGLSDIAEHIGCKRQATDVYLKRAVAKICAKNNKDWAEFHGGSQASAHPELCV